MRARDGKTDNERIAELEAQAEFLTEQMHTTDDKSDVAKLANAISQTHHMRTAIEHLKLQRLKSGGTEDEALDQLPPAELAKRIDATTSELKKCRASLKAVK